MKRLTTEWVSKAEDDLHAATALASGPKPVHDIVCFHCQQAAEKYLKALLQELGQTIPRTRDLDRLFLLLTTHRATLRPLRRGMRFLTDFAAETRYPGRKATKRQSA